MFSFEVGWRIILFSADFKWKEGGRFIQQPSSLFIHLNQSVLPSRTSRWTHDTRWRRCCTLLDSHPQGLNSFDSRCSLLAPLDWRLRSSLVLVSSNRRISLDHSSSRTLQIGDTSRLLSRPSGLCRSSHSFSPSGAGDSTAVSGNPSSTVSVKYSGEMSYQATAITATPITPMMRFVLVFIYESSFSDVWTINSLFPIIGLIKRREC